MCTSIINILIDVTLQVAKESWNLILMFIHFLMSGFLMTDATTVFEKRKKDPPLWLGTVPTVHWLAAQGQMQSEDNGTWTCKIFSLEVFKKFFIAKLYGTAIHWVTVGHCSTYRRRVQVTHLEECEGIYCSWSNLYVTCYRTRAKVILSFLVLPWSNKKPK